MSVLSGMVVGRGDWISLYADFPLRSPRVDALSVCYEAVFVPGVVPARTIAVLRGPLYNNMWAMRKVRKT